MTQQDTLVWEAFLGTPTLTFGAPPITGGAPIMGAGRQALPRKGIPRGKTPELKFTSKLELVGKPYGLPVDPMIVRKGMPYARGRHRAPGLARGEGYTYGEMLDVTIETAEVVIVVALIVIAIYYGWYLYDRLSPLTPYVEFGVTAAEYLYLLPWYVLYYSTPALWFLLPPPLL